MSNVSRSKYFASLRVLIVEDNIVDREILKSQLEKMGFENIQEARNGTEGIFKIENTGRSRNAFDLMITDWKMPERDGLALIKYLRSERSLRGIRVMMLTSVADAEKVKYALQHGIDDFVIKPIDYDVLVKKVERLVL